MKISYKETDDKLSCEIFVDDEPAGSVFINVYNQKWFLKPNFLRATFISLSQFDPGKTMTDDFILLF